jgi:hypothetical protein
MDECRAEWKGTKTQTNKKEGKESKNPDTTGSMRGVWQRNVGTKREKISIGGKERKEGTERANWAHVEWM